MSYFCHDVKLGTYYFYNPHYDPINVTRKNCQMSIKVA